MFRQNQPMAAALKSGICYVAPKVREFSEKSNATDKDKRTPRMFWLILLSFGLRFSLDAIPGFFRVGRIKDTPPIL